MSNVFVCKRLRLCRYLIDRGYEPYKIVPDKDNPRFNVYLFNRSAGLTEAVMDYFITSREMRNPK